MRSSLRLLGLAALLLATCTGQAAGPRWVTGPPYYYASGWLVYWQSAPIYYTDPGDLSQYVDHAAADAIVDAAAAVWNVPTAYISLSRGGLLDEDVSGANVYLASTGIVFPADVQPTNFGAKPIAVIYDRDGAVTDLLLGSGASSPSSCRQNAVTESVDSIATNGRILHAVLILNGRCTGPAPEQQLQMQYQLMRAFGRILGLGWSQTNDNVFTGNPSPTYLQTLHWPVMHPIDVICGPYTYQCMPSPFSLREDDLSSLAYLYPNLRGYTHPAGKVDSLANANGVQGTLSFPNGQGMQGVNVVVRRMEPFWNIPEAWESVSSVSGYLYRRRNGNPVSGALAGSPAVGIGAINAAYEGFFSIYRVPLYDWFSWDNLVTSTQAINPLYIGNYAVGPYDIGAVLPSGSSKTSTAGAVSSYSVAKFDGSFTDAASGCDTSTDGTETAPAPVTASGWWSGNLCSYGHASWVAMPMAPNRTLTVELTALDEQGAVSTGKMMPVTGAWLASDAAGLLPTVATAPNAFNSLVSGMTAMQVASPSATSTQSLRLVIADQRGDGRPDYNYQARVFYAQSIAPAQLPAGGGAVTITGMGFRSGNAVTVAGVAATVTGWTANTVTLAAPALHAAGAVLADVSVRDLATGATSVMRQALSYAAPQPVLQLVSAPQGTVLTGVPATVPFRVQAFGADGVTPLAGATIVFAATVGQARLSPCLAASCTITTDAQGMASVTVTALAAGAIGVSATSNVGTQSMALTAIDRVQSITISPTELYLAAGSQVAWTEQAQLADNATSFFGVPLVGTAVQWTSGGAGVSFLPATTVVQQESGTSSAATAGPLAAGAEVVSTACAWSTVCANLSVYSVGADRWQLEAVGAAGGGVGPGQPLPGTTLRVTDGQGHAVAGAPVTVHQTLEPYPSAACDAQGRCPIAPVYRSSVDTAISGLDGTVTVTPLDLAGQPVVVRVAVAAGVSGFLSFVVERHP